MFQIAGRNHSKRKQIKIGYNMQALASDVNSLVVRGRISMEFYPLIIMKCHLKELIPNRIYNKQRNRFHRPQHRSTQK